MTEVPGSEWTGRPPDAGSGQPMPLEWPANPARVTHVFTHFRLELDVYLGEAGTRPIAPSGRPEGRALNRRVEFTIQ